MEAANTRRQAKGEQRIKFSPAFFKRAPCASGAQTRRRPERAAETLRGRGKIPPQRGGNVAKRQRGTGRVRLAPVKQEREAFPQRGEQTERADHPVDGSSERLCGPPSGLPAARTSLKSSVYEIGILLRIKFKNRQRKREVPLYGRNLPFLRPALM